uniref:Uncharacterized protein n=1 Tax=viral metagenome TaxID=1070528 RepID=A0A6C0JMH1_9ZZZZ
MLMKNKMNNLDQTFKVKCVDDNGCQLGAKCNKITGECEAQDCREIPCQFGGKCNKITGRCYGQDCRQIPCQLGAKCNKITGECEGQGLPDTNICDSQEAFNHAFYRALKYTRKKDDKKIAGVLAVYLVIHTIFLIWGIVLAFKSQPPQNRVVHVTLAIVFAPAYVLAYYLNMF